MRHPIIRLLTTSLLFLYCLQPANSQDGPVANLVSQWRNDNCDANTGKIIGPAQNVSLSGNPNTQQDVLLKNNNSTMPRVYGSGCPDSSFVKNFEAPGRAFSYICSAKGAGGTIFVGGFGRSKSQGPPYKFMALLSKFDSLGNHLWTKEITSDVHSAIVIERIQELSDGSIIISGTHDNSLGFVPNSNYTDFFIAKLTPAGDIIWLKTYHAQLANVCSSTSVRYITVAEGLNGELIFAGSLVNCPWPSYLTVFKTNSSGTVLWKYAFLHPGGFSYVAKVFYEDDHVLVINRSANVGSGSDESIRVDFVKLNYATGAFQSQKTWRVDLPYPSSFYHSFSSIPSAIKLDNGNYCVYGTLAGDWNANTTNQPRFGVLEFNTAHDFVKGYTINSSLATNSSESGIKVNRKGHVFYTLGNPGFTAKEKYLGMADNGTILNQRVKTYPNREMHYNAFEPFENGSSVFIQITADIGQANMYLDYYRLHPSDTGSLCLGLDANFSYVAPTQYKPYSFTWSSIDPNPFVETNNQGNSTLPLNFVAPTPCYQIASCDTIKIHGNASSCNLQQLFTFTAFKNTNCGSAVKWEIDPSIIQSKQIVNDTTIALRFNQSFQGWLYGSLSTGCGTVTDSILVTIYPSPGPVNLGADTSICRGNSITLNARRGYKSYRWNNGTIDSTLTVTNPGTYYVDVTDACDQPGSDTVIIHPAAPIPFDIGSNRIKCNNDTIWITAPPGFMNYTWGPAYNINALNGPSVVVNPQKDTLYYVSAEKTPGCFAYDTVKISVRISPPIDLGSDRSFCMGDSAILDAGAGFNGYAWNNGASGQQISVFHPGEYSIAAIASNGCVSYDTLRVANVWPNPVVQLDNSPDLCAGSVKNLSAGNYSKYLWQDGSTAPVFRVSDIGTYHVTVWDHHQCYGSDTVQVTRILPLPTNFLPRDTTICSYDNLVVRSSGSFNRYTWSNGTNNNSLNISSRGVYWLQVVDGNGCTGRDSILVTQKDCLAGVHIPTAFTPDNNGRNDVLKPFIGGIVKSYQFTVYNRWGQIVFTTKDISKGWNGQFNGVVQDSNVYAWHCVYQLEGEEVKHIKGTVMLIR
ncbi:MAG TPA: T9SS type B sorting domain-containing protein [Chitinophagaceae bacterium]